MGRKFKPMTPEEYERLIENRYQADHADRRWRSGPILLLFYGLVVPLASLLSADSQSTLQLIIWTWAAIAAVACIVASVAESNIERANRYSKWLAEYDQRMKQRATRDDVERPARRTWYQEELAKYSRTASEDH